MGNSVKNNLILISGSGRSGTNILKRVISSNSRVTCVTPYFDPHFIISPCGVMDFYNSFSSTWSPFYSHYKIGHFEKFLLKLSKRSFFEILISRILRCFDKDGTTISIARYCDWELSKHYPNFEHHVNEMMKELKTYEYSGSWTGTESYSIKNKMQLTEYKGRKVLAGILGKFISNCVSSLLERAEKDFFIDSDTHNFLFAKEFSELIPTIKLIHIIRDPRDVIASYMNMKNGYPSELIHSIFYYKLVMQRWFSIKPNFPSENLLEVKLENLVNDTNCVVNKACDFIGIALENKMLEVDLSKSHSGRWKEEFTDDEKAILNDALYDILNHLEYCL